MKVLVKDIKDFRQKLKNIGEDYEVDVQFWVMYGKPSIKKQLFYNNNENLLELSIYYNYKKDLFIKIAKNRVVSKNDNYYMTTEIERIKEDFIQVKQASKKNLLEKAEELKNIRLEDFI